GNLSGDWGFALVSDVQKAPRKQHLHSIEISSGELRLGDKVVAEIDSARRLRIMANHSSAHLLQAALKKIVGTHIAQAGSFVSDEYMRFDFTHYEKVSDKQVKEIEALVNKEVFAQHPVTVEFMSIEDAKESGATALFDEKYEDIVRVITMGDVSKELCGGTHVNNTKEIGVFKIDSEESIGSGIRRITTKSGMKAYQDFVAIENQLESIAQLVRMQSTVNLESKIAAMLEDASNTKRELDKLNQKMLNLKAQQLALKVVEHNGLNILLAGVEETDAHGLKTLSESLKRLVNDGLVFLWLKEEEKVTFVVTCSPKAIAAGFKAGDLAKEAAVITGGNGGGRPDFAQSGGKEVSKLSLAIETIRSKLGLSL
ncbi:MAG: alanine--tRNA ligase, partial [Erysipelothrix sp.]|nr:alanine--tRNA ligase [Erysipelothrix sp.]